MDGGDEMEGRRYRSLLVAYDGSAFARAAFRPAAEIAARAGAHLHLARALRRSPDRMVPIQPAPRHGPGGGARTEAVSYEADLAAIRGELESTWDVEVSTRLLRDDRPPRALERHAREVSADLVVATTRSRSGPERALLGSTTTALLDTLDRPILLIPADEPTPDPDETPMQGEVACVVAAVEHPDASGRVIVDHAVSLAGLFDARVKLVHLALDAPVPPPGSLSALPVPGGWSPSVDAAGRREAVERLTGWAAHLYDSGHGSSPELGLCSGAGGLLDFARDVDADLVVMGRRDGTVLARLGAGKPSDRVHRRLGAFGLLVIPGAALGEGGVFSAARSRP